MTVSLSVGQQVRAHSMRWTPDGWVPVVELATVLNPCITNDADYAGDVEITIPGVISRTIVSPDSLDPVEAEATDFECADCRLADPGDCMRVGYCRHRDGPRGDRRTLIIDDQSDPGSWAKAIRETPALAARMERGA